MLWLDHTSRKWNLQWFTFLPVLLLSDSPFQCQEFGCTPPILVKIQLHCMALSVRPVLCWEVSLTLLAKHQVFSCLPSARKCLASIKWSNCVVWKKNDSVLFSFNAYRDNIRVSIIQWFVYWQEYTFTLCTCNMHTDSSRKKERPTLYWASLSCDFQDRPCTGSQGLNLREVLVPLYILGREEEAENVKESRKDGKRRKRKRREIERGRR